MTELKNTLLKLKEDIFLYLFHLGFFDLNLMREINIAFDNLIKELC